jgi:hypothetical protein
MDGMATRNSLSPLVSMYMYIYIHIYKYVHVCVEHLDNLALGQMNINLLC